MLNPTLVNTLNNRSGRMLLSFDHGLGDLVNFLPIYQFITKHFRHWRFHLATNFDRGLQQLFKPKTILDTRDRGGWPRFDYYHRVQYPEPVNDTISKPHFCAQEEFGLDPALIFWTPTKLFPRKTMYRQARRVGVHFFGHTSPHNKSCSVEEALMIWQGLEAAGYHPFEIQMMKPGQDVEEMPGITPANSLRFQPVNLQVMVDFLYTCEWFVGIDSGPLYTALATIGSDRCVGLERKNCVQNYAPCVITTLALSNYQQGSICDILKNKEGKP